MFETSVYLDNASSTRLDERVLEAMKPYFFEVYAVATSEFGYSMGIEAKEAQTRAREKLAGMLRAGPEEVVFTSGSTESSNMAIKGVALALGKKKGRHIITSKIEDFPVLASARALERDGFEVTYLEVDGDGIVDLDRLQESIKKETILVSIQHGNQEIGTVQDVEAIGQICMDDHVLFHTDATHTFRLLPIDAERV
ncbi:MAG TPA: aminotransferase class V-fold PLP-dependent enzyme, partial [Methanotrichaceae archaeon]|nr:aminotransferase class V-fold PLP-dependent enzyme [Methanotrichaceae archaeon]